MSENNERRAAGDLSSFDAVIETQPQFPLSSITPEQFKAWEAAYTGIMAGNDALRVRPKMIPPGFHYVSLLTPGRFQIVQMSGSALRFDTATGRTWQIRDNSWWEEVPVREAE